MKEQIFCQFLIVMMLLSSSQIDALTKGEIMCNLRGFEVLTGCTVSIYKELPTPPKPSKDCCTLVNVVGMKCACQVINKEIKAAIDMQKLVNVAAACGRPLVPGSHCGGYLVPGGMKKHHE